MRALSLVVVAAALVTFSSGAAFAAGDAGTADEAKALLMKAVAAVKADKAKAIDMINKGEGGLHDRDLYVACSDIASGKIVANGNPNLASQLGTDLRNLKDGSGKTIGPEIHAMYQKPEGEISEIGPYMFPRPGADKTPVAKMLFVTHVGDVGCAAGYYK